MKTPWLKTTPSLLMAALSTLTAAAAIACAAPNADFCETNDQCAEGSVCDLKVNACRATVSVDGGDDSSEATVPSEPGETCDGAGQMCLKAAPVGWTGPLAKADAHAGENVAGCSDVFSEDGGLFGSEITETGSCSCECDSPTSLSCGNATIREWTSASEGACEQGVCDILGSSCSENSQTLQPGSCTRINANMGDEPFLRASFGQITSGTCAQPEVFGEFSSNFTVQTRLCETEINSHGCALDEVCAPSAPDGFSEGLCIAREGDHECPANLGYTERTVLFTDIDDNRECDIGGCGCAAPTGSCRGKIELHNGGVDDDLCNGALATLERASSPFADSNTCQSLPASASTARYVIDPDAHSCRPTGEAGIAGSAVGTGATTLCCMP